MTGDLCTWKQRLRSESFQLILSAVTNTVPVNKQYTINWILIWGVAAVSAYAKYIKRREKGRIWSYCYSIYWKSGGLFHHSFWGAFKYTAVVLLIKKQLGRYDMQNCGFRMHRECWECFPHHRLQRQQLVSDLRMHHGTCVTHVPWCISGSLNQGGGENVPGIPGACTTLNFTYLAKRPMGFLYL